jgi:DNA (cytosine-5)-methyltransferase 1
MFRTICELRPKIALLENVPGLLDRGASGVLADLASIGFDAEWETLPAAAFGAPHLRYRVFIVAYPAGSIENGEIFCKDRSKGPQIKLRNCRSNTRRDYEGRWGLEPGRRVVRMADGLPPDLDSRLKCLGNAVVPQVAEWIGRRIMECHLAHIQEQDYSGETGSE